MFRVFICDLLSLKVSSDVSETCLFLCRAQSLTPTDHLAAFYLALQLAVSRQVTQQREPENISQLLVVDGTLRVLSQL